MRGLLIVGAGGHGKVIADIASAMEMWEHIAFVDDKFPDLKIVLDWPVIGNIDDFKKYHEDFSHVFIAVGDNRLRQKITTRVEKEGFKVPVLIHPRAAVSRFAVLGAGTVVINQAAVNAGAIIGNGCIINTGATIGHDCELGDFVHVAPGASIAGEAIIGDGSWIGMGSAVIEQIKVGKGVVVGAGSVVIKDVPDGKLVVGIPGRVIRTVDRGLSEYTNVQTEPLD